MSKACDKVEATKSPNLKEEGSFYAGKDNVVIRGIDKEYIDETPRI